MALITGTPGNDSLSGGNENDIIKGLDGDDTLWGSGGFDRVFGGAGDDRVDDSQGGDLLYGGSGVDTLRMFYGTFFGGGIGAFEFTFVAGQDTVTPFGSTASGFESVDITGSNGDDTIAGGRNDDLVRGWEGDDWLAGRRGADFMIGDNGADTMYGGNGKDYLTGGGHDDVLYGGAGDDTLIGGGSSDVYQGDDTLVGGAGADLLRIGPNYTTLLYAASPEAVYVNLEMGVGFGGDAQGDRFQGGMFDRAVLVGSAFDDYLIGGYEQRGGAGDDRLEVDSRTARLTGGEGRDVFAFKFVLGNYAAGAVIADFDQALGEVIDLSRIDARGRVGDQAFEFIGTDAFTDAPGQLRYEVVDGRTVVQMNLDRDPDVEHFFYLDGEYALTAADFVL